MLTLKALANAAGHPTSRTLSEFASSMGCESQGCSNPGLELANAFSVLSRVQADESLWRQYSVRSAMFGTVYISLLAERRQYQGVPRL